MTLSMTALMPELTDEGMVFGTKSLELVCEVDGAASASLTGAALSWAGTAGQMGVKALVWTEETAEEAWW